MNESVPGYEFEVGGARRGVVRSAIIHTPLFIIALGVFLTVVVDLVSGDGSVILLIVFAVVVIVTGYQSISALLDLKAPLVETTGPIKRKWSRSDFFFWRSYYLHVEKQIFTISRVPHDLLQPDDVVVVKHLPHSGRVEAISRVRPVRTETEAPAPSASSA